MRISDYETTKQPNSRDFETETKKSAGAPEPPAPPSLAPLSIVLLCKEISFMACIQFKCNPKAISSASLIDTQDLYGCLFRKFPWRGFIFWIGLVKYEKIPSHGNRKRDSRWIRPISWRLNDYLCMALIVYARYKNKAARYFLLVI